MTSLNDFPNRFAVILVTMQGVREHLGDFVLDWAISVTCAEKGVCACVCARARALKYVFIDGLV
jgi:hypothetical protein